MHSAIGIYYSIPAEIELTGVCNRTEESVKQACGEEGFKIGTTDFMELIRNSEIDVISCCTPSDTHMNIIMGCLEYGKPLNCEKPLCRNMSEAGDRKSS